MAGPWEKYQSATTTGPWDKYQSDTGPWDKYAANTAEEYAPSFQGPLTQGLLQSIEPELPLPQGQEAEPPFLERPPEEETLSDRIHKFLFEPEGAQTTREAIQGAIKSIPHMALDTAKMGYKGLRMAMGGPEERARIMTEDVIPSALGQGQQTAADIQAPFGTPEFLRGAGQIGMMALPGLEAFRELRNVPEVPSPLEPPPIQAPPEVPVTPPINTPLNPKPLYGPPGETAADVAAAAVEVPVQHGEFAQPGYTAVETAPAAAPAPEAPLIPPEDVRYAGGEPPALEVQPETPPAPPVAEPVPGIANRYIEEQIAAGTLPEEALVGGEGTTQAKAIAGARAELAQDPNAGFKAARRVTAGKMLPGDPARLHAYHDALAEASGQAGKAAIENPGNPQIIAAAKAAEQAHIDFLQNVLPKAKGMAQQTLVGFQGAVPPDLATFTGMQKELLEFNGGKPLTPQERMNLYRRDQKGARFKTAERNGLDRMQKEIDRTLPRMKVPTPKEMQTEMAKFIERVTPCI